MPFNRKLSDWSKPMSAKFSKRDYVLVARVLKDTRPANWQPEVAYTHWEGVVVAVTKEFLHDNPKFNLRKFYAAIGVSAIGVSHD